MKSEEDDPVPRPFQEDVILFFQKKEAKADEVESLEIDYVISLGMVRIPQHLITL